jgi:predicted transcriptional regulator
MIRIDVAGNISKRFSASGVRFARCSGACPRWNVFSAFLTPDCEQRALPSIKVPLSVDANVRGVSLYAPIVR